MLGMEAGWGIEKLCNWGERVSTEAVILKGEIKSISCFGWSND